MELSSLDREVSPGEEGATELPQPSRRQALLTGLAGLAMGVPLMGQPLAQGSPPAGAAPAEQPARRALRLAHLSDVHVQPELAGDEGFAAALRHVQSLADKPEVIIFGGDCIMDAYAATADRTRLQWALWQAVLKAECSLPFENCIGNHDVFGWSRSKSGATGREPLYGKAWALDALGLANRYRRFDRGGWRVIVLDSTHPGPQAGSEGYIGQLDEAQFDWLSGELDATPAGMPVLVVSHIPIISLAAMLYYRPRKDRSGWSVPASEMHIDNERIRDLFARHPGKVRLCLSGHVHLLDRCEFEGVTYICDGAVSGAWWKGAVQRTNPGYGIVDLYSDGRFAHQYIEYGWQPRKV